MVLKATTKFFIARVLPSPKDTGLKQQQYDNELTAINTFMLTIV